MTTEVPAPASEVREQAHFVRILRRAREWSLPGVVFAAGLWWLVALVRSVPSGVFFSGDGGLKTLMARQLLDGRFVPWLQNDQPGWVQDLWNSGMYPFQPPFVHHLDGRWYSSFEWTFPALLAPTYALAGHQGLYLLPTLGVVAVWLRFLWLLRGLGVGPVPAATSLALLVFATPLTFYAATIWEHAPAVAIAFAGYADLIMLHREPRNAGAIRAGVLLGIACWLRPEAMVFGATALAVYLPSSHRSAIVRGALAFGSVVAAIFVSNRALYGEWLGVHAIQVVERERDAEAWIADAVELGKALADLFIDHVNFWWLALLLTGGVLTSRSIAGLASRRTLLVGALAFIGTSAIVPNNGGLQIGPRYLLLLVPLAALSVALGLEQLRLAGRPARWTVVAISLSLAGSSGYEHVVTRSQQMRLSYANRILPSVRAIERTPSAGVLFGHHWAAMEMSEVIAPGRPVATIDSTQELNRAVEVMFVHGLEEVVVVDGPGRPRFLLTGRQRHGAVWVEWTQANQDGEYHVVHGARSMAEQ